MALITRQDWVNNVDTAGAIKLDAITRFIREAETFELRRAINNSPFYNTLLIEGNKDPVADKWLNILNPYNYQYEGKNYSHQGIRLCLVYWSYGRYLRFSDIAATPFGAGIKVSEFTQPLQQKKINELVTEYNRSADTLYLDVKFYLERYVDEFEVVSEEVENDKDLAIEKVAGPGVSYGYDYRRPNYYPYYRYNKYD